MLMISKARSRGAKPRKSAKPTSVTKMSTSCSVWSIWEHIGTMETNAFVQCVAAVLSLLVLVFWRTGSFAALGAAPKYCWFGGVLALAITVTVMLGMGRLGPTLAVATILIAQLATAAAIDAFGIMGTEKLAFGWGKWAGLALMTGGMLLFKIK